MEETIKFKWHSPNFHINQKRQRITRLAQQKRALHCYRRLVFFKLITKVVRKLSSPQRSPDKTQHHHYVRSLSSSSPFFLLIKTITSLFSPNFKLIAYSLSSLLSVSSLPRSLSAMSEHQSEEIQQIEKLYEFSERLNASKDKSQVPISPQLGFLVSRDLKIGKSILLICCFFLFSECRGLRGDNQDGEDEYEGEAACVAADPSLLQVLPHSL